jgi:hypothetical protein
MGVKNKSLQHSVKLYFPINEMCTLSKSEAKAAGFSPARKGVGRYARPFVPCVKRATAEREPDGPSQKTDRI